MIEELTDPQIRALAEVADQWLAHGLATGPADRPEAEAGVADAYRAAGLEPPTTFVWLDSPLAGAVGAWVLAGAKAEVRDQVGADIWDRVEARVRDQVRGGAGDLVRGGAGDPVRSRVWGEVRDEVGARVRPRVEDQVWVRIWEGIRGSALQQVTSVRNAVRAEVAEQLRDRVWAGVRDGVEPPLRAQLKDGSTWAEIQDRVRDVVLRGRAGARPLKSVPGQHDAEWLGFYDYFRGPCSLAEADRLSGLMRVARSAGRWWPFERVAVLTERPSVLHRDSRNRLHGEAGPAIAYPDGFAVLARHGELVRRGATGDVS
ncbi:DUF6745 domain-containing protein [Streptomyces sp. NPDC098781]|uniref:DUF6745 domain-containing protein n=1 Tax=Streptomyces sp. NPDC098781 TaxID=3366097 RepID=UPI003826E094